MGLDTFTLLSRVQSDDDRHPHHLSTGFHPQQHSEESICTAFTRSSQRHNGLPHRCRARVFTTTLNHSHVHVHIDRAKHTLPRHPPTLRHLPRKTRSRHPRRSRLAAAHADGVPHTHTRSRWDDTRCEGTRRGGKCARKRGANGGTTESRAQGSARVCRGWIEGWVTVTGCVRRSVPAFA